MIDYRGHQYARRRMGCRTVWHIFKNGKYIAYGDTPAEARALIDTYEGWGADRIREFTLSDTLTGVYSITRDGTETFNFYDAGVKLSLPHDALARLRTALARTPLPPEGHRVYEIRVSENRSSHDPYVISFTIEARNEAEARAKAIPLALNEWDWEPEDADFVMVTDIAEVR